MLPARAKPTGQAVVCGFALNQETQKLWYLDFGLAIVGAMKTATVIPGHTISESQYEAAAAGGAEHAPDLPRLTWERFVDAADWALIPDDQEDGYRAEFVLLRTRERTLKVNAWYLPDLRGGSTPRPHNHPWRFTSYILGEHGGYTEDRWTRTDSGILTETGVEHLAGTVNDLDRRVYHEVTAIHEPGTLTLMVCGLGERGAWGYLGADGEHIPYVPDPEFATRFATLNPHLAPKQCVPTKRRRAGGRGGAQRHARVLTRG
jgi:hypothetical protein